MTGIKRIELVGKGIALTVAALALFWAADSVIVQGAQVYDGQDCGMQEACPPPPMVDPPVELEADYRVIRYSDPDLGRAVSVVARRMRRRQAEGYVTVGGPVAVSDRGKWTVIQAYTYRQRR